MEHLHRSFLFNPSLRCMPLEWPLSCIIAIWLGERLACCSFTLHASRPAWRLLPSCIDVILLCYLWFPCLWQSDPLQAPSTWRSPSSSSACLTWLQELFTSGVLALLLLPVCKQINCSAQSSQKQYSQFCLLPVLLQSCSTLISSSGLVLRGSAWAGQPVLTHTDRLAHTVSSIGRIQKGASSLLAL